MSTYSKNLFDILGDGEVPRPQPVKEEAAAPVVVDKKNVGKINKDAARAAKGTNPKRQGGRQQKEGRAPRRQFDRHSGTGIVDTEKKINKGWGKAESSEAEAAKDTLSPADPDAPEQEAAAAPVEEEEQVKTLEEYLAEKANKSLKVSLPEARKANDADESAFKGTVAFAKEEVGEFFVSNKEAKIAAKKEKTQKKVFVDIEQRFQEKARPEFRKNNNNDRRGGRGGNSKNNGRRGANKSASAAAPAVNLQDAAAFPTLGATA